MSTELDTYYLYSITNTKDKGTYIGVTNNTNRRFREHLHSTSNKYLKAAIEAYGKSSFIFTVLEVTTRDKIDELEVNTILNYRNKNVPLYNIAIGGLIGNGSPGEEHWNHTLTEQDIIHIRELYSSNTITQRKIAELYNTGYKNISKIIRGERWDKVAGPITTSKLQVSKVANRRKMTDTQIIEVRNKSLEEFNASGTINIPSIAELYGISRQSMRLLLKGISYTHISGPILGKDYYKDFGRCQ